MSPSTRLAAALSLPRRITADTALRLARYFSTTAQFWINLQTQFDLEVERDAIADALAVIQPLKTA